ncbi:hypothetical protein EDD11_004695 [Mortierella claussenii]|nr:hypothetical protein EDD11_004695 [Mortierella claussenii]
MEQQTTHTSDQGQSQQTPRDDTDTASAAPHGAPQMDHWCHQCQREITPMMVPDPMCPHCHSEFVEKIEADNDPRTFVRPDPQQSSESYSANRRRSLTGHREPVNIDDLFQLFQAITNPQRAMEHQQPQRPYQPQQDEQGYNQHDIPGQMYRRGTQVIFNSGPMGSSRSFMASGPGTPSQPASQSHPPDSTAEGQTVGRESESSPENVRGRQRQQQQQQQQGAQWHSPPAFISGLLSRLGIEVHYTTDPAALQGSSGLGGPSGMGSGGGGGSRDFFPVVGHPGDYVWGQGGLDDIISQMMELQNRQHGPVGATDEIINAIPSHQLTDEELVAIRSSEATILTNHMEMIITRQRPDMPTLV